MNPRVLAVCGAICVVPLAHPAMVWGQACVDPTTIRAGGSVAISIARHAYATAYAASAAVGRRWQGSVSVGITRDSYMQVNATNLGAELRRVIRLGSGPVHLCPVFGFSAEFGPRYDLLSPNDDDVRRTGWRAGFNGSLALKRDATINVSLTGGYLFWRMTAERSNRGQRLYSVTDTYSTLRGGVSVMYRRWLIITPEIGTTYGVFPPDQGYDFAAPFGHENGEASLSLSLAVALGKRVAAH